METIPTTSAVTPDDVTGAGPERYLAIDLGRTRLAAGVVDGEGAVLVRDRVSTPARHIWPTLARLVSRVVAASPDDVRPTACGVACAGEVVQAGGETVVRMPGWEGFALAAELERSTGLPVAVDSGGRAFALAELWCGDAAGERDFVAILAGDVVDAGIVSGGRLLDGRTSGAGGIGHLVVEPGGRECVCGDHGCLEAYAAAGSIEADTNRTLRRTPVAIVERTGIMIARAVASVAAMVDTTHVLLAGSVPSVFGDPLFEVISRELVARSRLAHLAGLVVEPVGPAHRGPLVGAAAVARRSVGSGTDR